MDPKDIGIVLTADAAQPSPKDARDHSWREVGFGTAPFDWSVGYDVEKELSDVLGKPFKEKTKNQGQSYSCGGQATGYLGGGYSVFQKKVFDEKSAKFIYAPIAQPGGGTYGRDLCDRVYKAGWAPESMCLSYENGGTPSEAFMVSASDITSDTIKKALDDKAISYAFVATDIDSIAQATQANKGILLGIIGANNGTWLSTDPKPPVNGDYSCWGHWVRTGKAMMRNGKKAIAIHNSWGDTVGDQGWQWLSEDYFTTVLTNSNRPGPAIFEARAIVFNPNVPVDDSFHYTFTKLMGPGSTGSEVTALQKALTVDGTFPNNIPTTGYYGNITVTSVQKFQAKYGIINYGSPYTTGYGRVGPRTLTKLNELFSK